MQVTLSINHLKSRLQQLAKAEINKRFSVQLDVANGRVQLSRQEITCGGDSIRLTVSIKAQNVVGQGVVEFSFSEFSSIVSHLVEPNVTMTIDGGVAVVESGNYRASLDCCWKKALASVPPGLPIGTIDLASLKSVLARVQFACLRDDSKFVISAIKIESTPEILKAISIEDRLLVIASQPCQAGMFDLLLPFNAVTSIRQLTGSRIAISEIPAGKSTNPNATLLVLTTDTEEIVAPCRTRTQFPPYENILPTEAPTTQVAVSQSVLASALERLRPFADDDRDPFIFSVQANGSTAVLHSRSCREEISATVEGPAQDCRLDLNQLLPAVRHASGKITMGIFVAKSVVDFHCGKQFRFLQKNLSTGVEHR